MARTPVTLGIVVLAGAGITMLWPTATLAAAADSERAELRDTTGEASAGLEAATSVASTALLRAVAEPEVRDRPDVVITGPAECIRQVSEPLRAGYTGALTFTCTSDIAALQSVADGRVDAAIVTVAFERALPDASLREFNLGDFVTVLVRHDENQVRDLTRTQLDELCRGRTRGWQDLGGRGSELRALSTFSGPVDEARALGVAQGLAAVRERGLSVAQVIARVQRDRAGLGVIAVRQVPDTLPCIAIDGVLPSATSFAAGSYPFGYRLRLVYRAEHRSAVAKLLTFLGSAEGQGVLGAR